MSLVSSVFRGVKKAVQLVVDLVDFVRSTPGVMMSMTLEENLIMGAKVTFWALLFSPLVFAALFFFTMILGIPISDVNNILVRLMNPFS